MSDSASTKADVKAVLAAAGQQLDPNAKLKLMEKPAPGVGAAVVVLERVTAGYTPAYCVHGYASCVQCNSMCFLGSNTERLCSSGEAYALCKQCADAMASEGHLTADQRIGNVDDHLRSAGPH